PAFPVAGHLDAVQDLARLEVAYLEPEQLVDVDEGEGPGAVDGEGPDELAEGPDLAHHLVRRGVRDAQHGRAQAGQVDAPAVEPIDGVVRAGVGDDGRHAVAGGAVDHAPARTLERWHVKEPAVGGDRHAVAAQLVLAVPQHLPGHEVGGGPALGRRDVGT